MDAVPANYIMSDAKQNIVEKRIAGNLDFLSHFGSLVCSRARARAKSVFFSKGCKKRKNSCIRNFRGIRGFPLTSREKWNVVYIFSPCLLTIKKPLHVKCSGSPNVGVFNPLMWGVAIYRQRMPSLSAVRWILRSKLHRGTHLHR